MKPLRIVIIGYGKIARDQHVPSIEANSRFELAATVARNGQGHPGLPCFTSIADMLRELNDIDAVAICTPPSARYEIGRECIDAGLQILLEKPPGASLSEVEDLKRRARDKDVVLFASWHAQHGPAVAAAARMLAGQRVSSMQVEWREDVRKWHPGQSWIWEPGGFGVFDPGINALSILSLIFPGCLSIRAADLEFPSNRQTPIAARLALRGPDPAAELFAHFDWRHGTRETWTIDVVTADGLRLSVASGGSRLLLDGDEVKMDGPDEYPALYSHFVDLIDERRSDVDLAPFRLVADAFLLGRRHIVEPFEE